MKIALAVILAVFAVICVALSAYLIIYVGGWLLCTTPLLLFSAGLFCLSSYVIIEEFQGDEAAERLAKKLEDRLRG